MNTFGTLLRLTTAGESHGRALIGILDGMPSGVQIDFDRVALEMSHRRPGGALASKRSEDDDVQFLSGILDGITLGTPIAFTIANNDAHSHDYEHLRHTFRPGHADYTYQAKYGIRDWRGGGRASARETALRVAAGAVALQVLENKGVEICAYTRRIGEVAVDGGYKLYSDDEVYSSAVRCPDAITSEKMEAAIVAARSDGDTLGGIVACVINGLPAGLGEPIYDKFQAKLSSAMMSINAAHGFEYGMGFAGASCRGTEVVDAFTLTNDGRVTTKANHSGGIQGGITNGQPVTFNVAFKPVATLMQPVESINAKGEAIMIEPRGRHDVCVVPRAVSVVRAMAALCTLDAFLLAGC